MGKNLIMADCWCKLLIAGGLTVGLMFSAQLSGVAETSHPANQQQEMKQLLHNNWETYKKTFIQTDGRVIDHRIGVTTSEGQSYAMLRAVWMRDRETFDRVYHWTRNNLQKRDNDKLFAWKWGQLHDQSWGMIDKTAATDADQDIALALIYAAKFWGDDRYRQDALAILNDIWELETAPSPIGRVLLPGDWKFDKRRIQLNPSYFAPYAYRVFAEFDKKHPWEQLVISSYRILSDAVALTRTHLPPDWVEFSEDDGSVRLYDNPRDNRSDYGYEAIRVFWRVGLDELVNPGLFGGKRVSQPSQPRSKPRSRSIDNHANVKLQTESASLLNTSDYLPLFWKIRNELPGTVTWHGISRKDQIESGAVYGASLPAFYSQDEQVAQEILDKRLIPNLKPGGQWNTPDDYYSQNWLWFGLALYEFRTRQIKFPKTLSATERLEWFLTPIPAK